MLTDISINIHNNMDTVKDLDAKPCLVVWQQYSAEQVAQLL